MENAINQKTESESSVIQEKKIFQNGCQFIEMSNAWEMDRKKQKVRFVKSKSNSKTNIKKLVEEGVDVDTADNIDEKINGFSFLEIKVSKKEIVDRDSEANNFALFYLPNNDFIILKMSNYNGKYES